MKKKWWVPLSLGLFLPLCLYSIDLPFQSSVFRWVMRIRGPITPSKQIVLVAMDLPHQEGDSFEHERTRWGEILIQFLKTANLHPPRVVEFDFDLYADLGVSAYSEKLRYPIFSESHIPTADLAQTPLVSSPEFIHPLTHALKSDPFLVGTVDVDLYHELDREDFDQFRQGAPRILNVVGPPGSYKRYSIQSLVENPALMKELEGQIVLVGAPLRMSHSRFGTIPFFPKDSTTGWDETEIDANVIDNIIHNRSLYLLPFWISISLTILVSFLTIWVLFSTSPLMSVLSVFLMTSFLFILALVCLNSNFYLDIHKSLYAILFAYYFLVPYRLILEYKGRWKYQQENKLMSEVETLKDNFMSLVSHNLKTPIARIQGAVESLLTQNDDPATVKNELQKILNSTDELNRFVTRILNLTQIERPEYRIRTASHDLNAVVESVMQTHQALADQKNIQVRVQLEPLFPIKMDRELIQESIANVVENAIKYTPPNGAVEILTGESGDWIQLTVNDTGPGISAHDAEKIFSKFYRGAEVKNKGIRGSGLGLYLVKYFIELHGGSVRFQNRTEGGSQFTLNLPRK